MVPSVPKEGSFFQFQSSTLTEDRDARLLEEPDDEMPDELKNSSPMVSASTIAEKTRARSLRNIAITAHITVPKIGNATMSRGVNKQITNPSDAMMVNVEIGYCLGTGAGISGSGGGESRPTPTPCTGAAGGGGIEIIDERGCQSAQPSCQQRSVSANDP